MQWRKIHLLLGCETCDPNKHNANGDTPLHIVSILTMSCEIKLQHLQLLLSTPGINPEALNNEHLAPLHVRDKDGSTLLHIPCAEEKFQLLIEDGADVSDLEKLLLLYIACNNCSLRVLLSCKCCNANQQNADGDTALHIVNRMTLSPKAKFQLLLSTPGIDTNIITPHTL